MSHTDTVLQTIATTWGHRKQEKKPAHCNVSPGKISTAQISGWE